MHAISGHVPGGRARLSSCRACAPLASSVSS